ncbi:MAG: Na+/H+ antiporter subunit C [Flavobacteriaceae bacterium CG_4_8_14_3_um_filter_34_10]|nr:Na+/H+ antiporter subunit C [Flavobacteriia bacterium]OIP51329.1 MAG: cation:proton antiporter [Flavobacteriaceae bacterium CG2_30_34_30]PIQ17853.1 MAG: Na+/H+ antiporter subunit C [Flavobacteriaceae bacterium CG18_big_fil_WC_8_21_14_2_50_34_36]PIV51256.1 MAG: Na+/H+ antiporter subunit C [Flavobacteriaceae bacterium CG02_land_8_20_14_3_00_34_13]PIX08380.1 MAG: Na+/H+ antiporter subunit C [Flavobacteriaceae bacterium CG_4_8_14_3_um_filter_34_10]PIZ07498.1 MAG: Na+/H+ antiporter subunit C [Fl
MEFILAILIGIFYASGLYMMLRRSLVKLIIGLILIGNGANLLIFLLGRITKGLPPIIPGESPVFLKAYADPIPQALILTAIVISFGLQSFAIVLVKRAYSVVKTDDLDQMNSTDQFS